MKIIKTLLAYPKYRKSIAKQQYNYDKMVVACANDQRAVICGERPKPITFFELIGLIIKQRKAK